MCCEDKIVDSIIELVDKHHNMKMDKKCAKALLNLLKSHCPKINSSEKSESCKCDPCECDPCACDPCECDPCECDPCKC